MICTEYITGANKPGATSTGLCMHVHGKVFLTYQKCYQVREILTIVGKVTMIESRLSSEYAASTLTSPAGGGDGSMEKCYES